VLWKKKGDKENERKVRVSMFVMCPTLLQLNPFYRKIYKNMIIQEPFLWASTIGHKERKMRLSISLEFVTLLQLNSIYREI